MLCDVCKDKEATVFLTQILNGKMQKVNLCEACSKKKGVTDPTGFALGDVLLGLGATHELEQVHKVKQCPVCGFTYADFKKTERLGCSACYDTFREDVLPLLKNMHKGTRHIGKAPKRLEALRRRQEELQNLREGLECAVAHEQYEKAAYVRDQIKKLEEESEG